MKWKLIIIAVVGAAALGFSKSDPLPHSELALCLIPFACCYIDLLCRNLSIRTKMIGQFMAKNDDPFELFYLGFKGEATDITNEYQKENRKMLSLESLALRWSSYFVSVVIIPVGTIVYLLDAGPIRWHMIFPVSLFVIAGVCGIFFSLAVENRYREQRDRIYS